MNTKDPRLIRLASELLPRDGRFGCGPSKVRPEQLADLMASGTTVLGTSHRQAPVKNLVGSIRRGLHDLFALPTDWEIVLGNGGSTVFWDVATFGLIESRSQHLVFGEFSSKFAQAAAAAPHLSAPDVIDSAPGSHPVARFDADVDTYAFTHNETSTGVMMPLERPSGSLENGSLVVVDATSAAGGLLWDPAQVDVYYFAPQKCFASDGGLWIAACSPRAIERIERIAATKRWTPASLDLRIALENSRADQTYNTPAVATLTLLESQIRWMNSIGGLRACHARSHQSSSILYRWAEERAWLNPFVSDPAMRSDVVATIDVATIDTATIDTDTGDAGGVDANDICAALRANGIVDTDSYRKLGRNQLRIGTFPAVDPDDVEALTACIDVVFAHLHG